MSAESLIGLATFRRLLNSNCDDWIDKLNHSYTTTILLIFATVVMSHQFVGNPIHCWTPAEFTSAYEGYTSSYCWIKNSYFLPMHETIPVAINRRMEAEITYYQWVPLILVFMAFFFKLPNIVWKLTNTHTGFNFKKAQNLLHKAFDSKEHRENAVHDLARFIDIWIRSHRYYKFNFLVTMKGKLSHIWCMYCNKREGKFLAALYLNIKILYVLNVIGQLYLLNAFLGMDYSGYGFEVLRGLNTGRLWRESPRFPRVTLCDFNIRQLQNVQRYTVQCVLPINLFNEKIFIFLWFWLLLVAILSSINLIKWVLILLVRRNNYNFLRKYLKITNNFNSSFDKKVSYRFANYYLRDDGCFVLRILGMNTSDLIVLEVIEELWTNYRAICRQRRRPPIDEDSEGVPYDNDATLPLRRIHDESQA